ncbi:MAG: tRNA (N6-threonylcarbamoyladenosine(37)-N6)-methyltransferase TrmO [Deltaproteobacteria bacterium]|nr:tRNA (N6-threonylcarbamoyladenosine(37)-N6)-methyltransferase TrmO [Deltaproteobacteria bacterium]
MIESFVIEPVGIIHSCFTEKFGIPRQPGMVKSATASLELLPRFNREEMIRGLDQFSHIWVHFLFHKTVEEGWKPTVRPPGLGGKKRVGVFATRSPHRPNHMGMSAVRLVSVRKVKTRFMLELAGVDFLDQTPVLDIKPYVAYSDSIESAAGGYSTGQGSEQIGIQFSGQAAQFCKTYEQETGRKIRRLIEEMIHHDPRPASQKGSKNRFGMLLWDVNIRWQVEGEQFTVLDCLQVH